ncbi:MAG: hypothetical protein H6713_31450 [Myxococcales bacterium]|nr:hypothetical protein [Myxococcales bacterium]MCB9754477.1 hypothetical protein [Myxococcales bacterium]
MPLTHFTDRHVVRLLATETRRADTTPHELTRSHRALGRFLAGELVELFPLERRPIQHPQGIRDGWRVAGEPRITLCCMMRAGLYATEGVREVLTHAPVVHVTPRRRSGLDESDLEDLGSVQGRRVVLIDAVINTGASLEPILGQLRERGADLIAVLALVCPVATARRLEAEHPDVHFILARISENQYVGKGTTDTGNRLFGTLPT